MRKSVPFSVRVSPPQTAESRRILSEKVARIHAESILHALEREHCGSASKAETLDQLLEICQNRTDLQ